MIPDAFILHRIADKRMRLKIPAKKGDAAYFSRMIQQLDEFSGSLKKKVNPLTATLVVEGEGLDWEAFCSFAQKKRLFKTPHEAPPAPPFTTRVAQTVQGASQTLQHFTGGEVDLPGALFMALLVFGVVEIIRGNFRSPPWYTAFWYAFGLYTKTILDRAKGNSA